MHSKKKGNIGQFGVGLALSKLGYSIFTEEGDISKIDLIAEKNNNLIRIQCKAITPNNNCLIVPLKKAGPNYQSSYKSNMFDYFGVYDLQDGQVYLIPADVLNSHSKSFNLRKEKSKNNQEQSINYADDYAVEKVLGIK